jgi:hypothetical protein
VTQGINPKDLIGSTKVDLDLLPGPAEVACALAMTDGAIKYGPYNWREPGKPVQARTYTSAARRHLKKWLDGEDIDPDSGVSHLGHAMACCAILIDAQSCGQLDDNRPVNGTTASALKEGESVVRSLSEKQSRKSQSRSAADAEKATSVPGFSVSGRFVG